MDTLISAARDLVLDGVRESGTPLSQTLEFHLSATLAKFMISPMAPDRLTWRLAQQMEGARDGPEVRMIGDECLICCGLFPDYLRSRGGTVRHYAGVGQTAYDSLGLTEQALGFPHMLDVLAVIEHGRVDDDISLMDMARAGSTRARDHLRADNIIMFPAPQAT